MKILVYEEPTNADECLFHSCEYSMFLSDVICTYNCSIDGKECVLKDENSRCDKLMPLKICKR